MTRRRRGLKRPRYVKLGDERSPMRRLLESAARRDGNAEAEYDAQWRTLFKAIRLGYVDDNNHALTDAGRTFLASGAK